MGFTYNGVNHTHEYKNSITGVDTNSIEGLWRGIKVAIPKRHFSNDMDLDSELACFVWRRRHEHTLWDSLLKAFGCVKFECAKDTAPIMISQDKIMSDGDEDDGEDEEFEKRLKRATTQKNILILSHVNVSLPYVDTFIVQGHTLENYNVLFKTCPTCSCPDMQSGNVCKHLIYVMLNHFKLKKSDPFLRVKVFTDVEITKIVSSQ